MAYFNRNNQVYQQRDNQNNTWGWFPNNQEIKRGETAPTEKGKREKVIGSNQQKEQLVQFNAAAAASGFQLSNTANMKEAIGKFKSSPYYSSVVNQQNQKKQTQQQHNQHLNNQGADMPKMSKQQHIQQISRIYQNNPTNILHSVTHNSNFLQNHSGGGTTTNKKVHALDPYNSQGNVPKYGIKLPQRPSTSHDQQQIQRKHNQIQGTTQYKNTQMSITNTDGFNYKKPQTPETRVATAGQRGSKLLNTSGNSLLNSSINNGNSLKQQQANGLYPLQVRNASLGNNGSHIKRRDTFSTNNNKNINQNSHNANLLLHKNINQIDSLTHKGTMNTRQSENNQTKQNYSQEQIENNSQTSLSQVKTHYADFKKEAISKQNFFTHENFYCQGTTKIPKQEYLDKNESFNQHEVIIDDMNDSFSNKKVNKQQLLKLSLPQNNKKQTSQQSIPHQNDDASESNTPRIIVTGNQEQQSHKIQFIDNSFTKFGDDEEEVAIDNKNYKKHSNNRRKVQNNNIDYKQMRQSNDDEGEGDDEHEDDQDEEDDEYHNYYNSGDADHMRDKQYAVPYDEDDDDYYGEEEQEDDEGEEEEDENYEDHEGHSHEEHEDQHYQFYHNQHLNSHPNNSSDENEIQNFIQDDEDDQQNHQNKEDQFGESYIQAFMRDKQQKEQKTQNTKGGQNRPMTTEGGRRRRGIETPVQNSIKQGESFSKVGQEFNLNNEQADNVDQKSAANRRQSEKENFNLCLGQNDSFNDEQFGQEFKIDFDTTQFERPPERGKQFMGIRVPIKVDHELINDENPFSQGPGKRPPSRHRIPNRAAGLGIPTQDLPDIPIKNMYDQNEDYDKISEQNKRFFQSEKLQIEKIKQAQDNEDTFMNFDFKNFGENASRKNSSRQPVAPPKMVNNDRPQSGNIKSRALNKRESFDDGVHQPQPEKVNSNNVQNLKLSNHPVSAKNQKKNNSINQKENDQTWDDFDDILNDKQTPKNIIRRLEGSDILIKHNVSSTVNNKKQNTTNQSVKVPFETSLGSDFLSLFANNFGN